MNSKVDKENVKNETTVIGNFKESNRLKSKSLPLLSKKDEKEITNSFNSVGNLSLKEHENSNSIIQTQPEISSSTTETVTNETKKLSLPRCVEILTGSIVSMGILVGGPQAVYQQTNNALICILIWLCSGIYYTMGALCYVELGTTLQLPGGDYTYLNKIVGPSMGFLYEFYTIFILIPCTFAVSTITLSQNLIVPYFEHNKCHPSAAYIWSTKSLAILLIVIFSVINSFGSSVFSKLHRLLYSLKLVALFSVLICGAVSLHQHGIYKYSNFTVEKSRDKYARKIDFCHIDQSNYASNEKIWDRSKFSQISTGVFLTAFSYLGFNSLNFIVDQVEDPRRTLPRVVALSMPGIVILYLLINFSYFVSMSGTIIINSEIIIHDLYKTVIPANIYKYIFWLAPTAVVFSVGGSLTGKIMSLTRIYGKAKNRVRIAGNFSLVESRTMEDRIPLMGAQNDSLPSIFALVSKKKSIPNPSVAFVGFIGSLFICGLSRKSLIALYSYLDNAYITATISSMIYLRFKEPYLDRPIRLPLFIPMLYVLLSIVLLLTPIVTIDDSDTARKTIPFLAGAGFVLLIGVPLYLLLVRRKPKPPCIVSLNDEITEIAAKAFDAVPEKTLEVTKLAAKVQLFNRFPEKALEVTVSIKSNPSMELKEEV